jgi:ATP phosphoribosyltransferase
VERSLKLGLPKGSLQESTFALLSAAGWPISAGSRSYYPRTDDSELDCRLLRPQEMSRYVENGKLDAGFAGKDWVVENSSDVEIVEELVYSKQQMTPIRWVLAVPEDSDIHSVKDLQGKRISTELVNTTRRYLEENGVQAEVEFSWGATEVKPPDLVDAIVDITETGSSLRANNLRIVDTVAESATQLFANRESWAEDWKREKLQAIGLLMQSAIRARELVGLKMNVAADKLDAVVAQLPALSAPTVGTLHGDAGFAIETVIAEITVRQIIPALRSAGATGIIEYPLNKVIP